MQVTALTIAHQYLGIREIPGERFNSLVLAMLQLDNSWVEDDETPWCSAFVNFVHFQLPGLPRSHSLAARSWLLVGASVGLDYAAPGYDIVVLKRGGGDQPGPAVIKAPGHVGFYVGHTETDVTLLGGNQGDAVSITSFPRSRILDIRRTFVE